VVGAGTVFLTQNAGNESFPSEQTLEQKLHQFRQMPSFTRAPEEEVRKYTDVLKDNQIIAVRGYSVYDRAPREAALSLIECLNDDKKLRIFESRSNSNIAIDSLPKEISKQEDFRDSVLLIDARRVQDSATSLRDMLVDQLVGAARDAQCYVVILVSPVDTSVDGKDTPDDADRCPVWVVGVKPPPVSASDKSALADKLNDPVDAAILLTATVFSGLDPMEFCAVVDALLPPLSPKAKTKEAPQREPASLERWRRGEHERARPARTSLRCGGTSSPTRSDVRNATNSSSSMHLTCSCDICRLLRSATIATTPATASVSNTVAMWLNCI
jgi:hypothetical protein